MSEPEVLLEDVSPSGNVCAVVEQSGGACHFYLFGEKGGPFGVRSCWVRNFGPAPERLSVEEMEEGKAPLLPREFCAHPEGAPPLQADELQVIWAEEGDAAALLERGELLVVLPSWSGVGGFHGYARDCLGESPLCWPLGSPETNAQFARFERAAEFWNSWGEDGGPWPALQKAQIAAIEQRLGAHTNYYAIDGQEWPPKAMLKIPGEGRTVGITVGVALRPQPSVERYFEDPTPHRRVELALAADASFSEEQIQRLFGYVSAQTNFPWSQFTFLGHGHTLPSVELEEISGGRFSSFLLVSEGLGAPEVALPPFRNEPVQVLWLVPITTGEREFAETAGSSILQGRMEDAGLNWVANLQRQSVT